MAKKTAAKGGNLEVPASIKKSAEEKGYTWRDRTAELSKWAKGIIVEGIYLGLKNGKQFSGKSEPSKLVKFRVEGNSVVYACPRVLEIILEDISIGSDVIVVCLGQNLVVKDRKEPAWDFDVAVKS